MRKKKSLLKRDKSLINLNRRDFLKIGATGTFVGATAFGGAGLLNADEIVAKKLEEHVVNEHESFPNKIKPDYKPFPQVKMYSIKHGLVFTKS